MRLGCGAGIAAGKAHLHRPWAIRVGGRSPNALATSGSSAPLPRATDVSLYPLPTMRDWHFLKAPLTVRAGAGPITLPLKPDADQRLAWVSAGVWTSGSSPNLADWTTTKVTFVGCRQRNVTYLGGLLTRRPNGCARVHVASQHKPAATFLWPYGSHRCNA